MKYYIILFINLIISIYPLFRHETVLADENKYKHDKYYTLGTKKAQEEYRGIKPYVTGIVIGTLLPAAVIATVSKIRKETGNSDFAEISGGVSIFAFNVFGGYKFVKMYKVPKPDCYLSELTEAQKQSFENGFTNRVKDKRFGNYTLGIYSGIAVNIAALLIILSGFEGFG